MDRQLKLTKLRHRCRYILKNKKWADCWFDIGISPNRKVFPAHRLLLAMASPVFERMFYGNVPEKGTIRIIEMDADAFEAMLDYIYTDDFSVSTFEMACDLYSVAKAHMLHDLVRLSSYCLMFHDFPSNACRVYEFAKLHDDKQLMESSMMRIVSTTLEVISDTSFMDIDATTIVDIFDQDCLDIDSELDLFNCLLIYAWNHGILNVGDEDDSSDAGSENSNNVVGAGSTSPDTSTSVVFENDISSASASASGYASESQLKTITLKDELLEAVKKIRFLRMTLQEFQEGPLRSKFLPNDVLYEILVKLAGQDTDKWSMPEGFCQLDSRDVSDRQCIDYICARMSYDHYKPCTSDFSLKFIVDKCIAVWGVEFKLLCTHWNDITKIRVCIEVIDGMLIGATTSAIIVDPFTVRLSFARPIIVHSYVGHNIQIVISHGYSFLLSSWKRLMDSNDVQFFIIGVNPIYQKLNSPLSSILFNRQYEYPTS